MPSSADKITEPALKRQKHEEAAEKATVAKSDMALTAEQTRLVETVELLDADEAPVAFQTRTDAPSRRASLA